MWSLLPTRATSPAACESGSARKNSSADDAKTAIPRTPSRSNSTSHQRRSRSRSSRTARRHSRSSGAALGFLLGLGEHGVELRLEVCGSGSGRRVEIEVHADRAAVGGGNWIGSPSVARAVRDRTGAAEFGQTHQRGRAHGNKNSATAPEVRPGAACGNISFSIVGRPTRRRILAQLAETGGEPVTALAKPLPRLPACDFPASSPCWKRPA